MTSDAGPAVPPPLTPVRFLTEWAWEWPLLLGVAIVALAYLWGVRTLHRRGVRWSPWRTLSFVAGLGLVVVATQSALAAYDAVLLSVHMVQHMLLAMVVPVLLALGAPVTLALRTLPPRARALLLAVLHSRVARVLTFPAVAGVIFVANPFVLYFSGLYEATLRHEWLHELNHVHFLLVGSLWFWTILGLDPLPNRPAHPLRMLAVFVTLPFHAMLGIAIMSQSSVLAADWYGAVHRHWGPAPLADQELAGGLLWAAGDILGLLVFAALFVQWARASEREAQREDRRLDRLERLSRSEPPGERARPADL